MTIKSSDPYSRVYAATMQALIDNADLCGPSGLVKLGNQIRFDVNDDTPVKSQRTEGDLPELALMVAGVERGTGVGSGNSSNSFGATLTMRLLLQTETGIIDDATEGIGPLLWQSTVSVERMHQDCKALGLEFVKNVRWSGGLLALGDARQLADENSPEGWYSIFSIMVDCVFSLESYIR